MGRPRASRQVVVVVRLLGEIDLTVGIVSGLCAGVMAVLNVKMGAPGPLAVGAAARRPLIVATRCRTR